MPVRLAVLTAMLAALVLPSAAARADNPALVGTVGQNDEYSIVLRDSTGARVTHLDPGTYTIVVHDLSSLHNFHLFGPGVDELTDIPGTGDSTWTVTFTDGRYGYHCDAHVGQMHGTFTVGTVATPPAPTKLSGAVGPGKRISLRYASGGKVGALQGTNQVVLTVNDRSKADNFHLTGRGVNRKTGVAFRGRVTWTLTLAQGARYAYFSDRHKRAMRGTFTVPPAS